MTDALAYLAAVLVALWGVAHVIPTRKVVAGFEPISADNRRVLVQEWLAEALTMWGVAGVVIVTAAVGGAQSDVARWVYRVVAGLLVALAILTALTGARTSVIWFKISGQDSNLGPLGYELTRRGLAQYARSHSCRSATFSRPTCLATSRLFASIPPCSVSKSVATTLSGKSNRLGVLRCKPGAASSGSTRGVKLTRRSSGVVLGFFGLGSLSTEGWL